MLERKLYLFIAIFLTIAITIGSLISIQNVIELPPVHNFDKFLHTSAYFLLTISWFLVFKKSYKLQNKYTLVMLIIFVYGTIIEVLQGSLTTYRQADLYDMFANLGGILIAYMFFNIFFKRN